MSEQGEVVCRDLMGLLDAQGSETPHELGRDLYKAIACGPWVAFELRDGRSIRYTDPEAREASPAWWDQCTGVRIGSIVEGSDAEIGPYTLAFPFSMTEFDTTVQVVDDEAGDAWESANGGDDDEGDAADGDGCFPG